LNKNAKKTIKNSEIQSKTEKYFKKPKKFSGNYQIFEFWSSKIKKSARCADQYQE